MQKTTTKPLNSQDSKTLNRLLKSYGVATVLTEIGKTGTDEAAAFAKAKANEVSELVSTHVRPALEKATIEAEKLIKSKILTGLTALKSKFAEKETKEVHTAPKAKKATKKKGK